jgi:hypothetical protein
MRPQCATINALAPEFCHFNGDLISPHFAPALDFIRQIGGRFTFVPAIGIAEPRGFQEYEKLQCHRRRVRIKHRPAAATSRSSESEDGARKG